MTFYEQEMRRMFSGNDIIRDAKFIGKTMLGKLDDELRVKLQFVTTGTAGEYTAIQATVINRTDGVVDKQTFKFGDIIGLKYHGCSGNREPYMSEYNNDASWYTPVSAAEKRQIADTVLDYVSMYQDEELSMSEPSM